MEISVARRMRIASRVNMICGRVPPNTSLYYFSREVYHIIKPRVKLLVN